MTHNIYIVLMYVFSTIEEGLGLGLGLGLGRGLMVSCGIVYIYYILLLLGIYCTTTS